MPTPTPTRPRAHGLACVRCTGLSTYSAPPSRDRLCRARAQGFDEYMNLVLDAAEEVSVKRQTRKKVGRILLKGDCITLMRSTQ